MRVENTFVPLLITTAGVRIFSVRLTELDIGQIYETG
jgi:hypothetical protein